MIIHDLRTPTSQIIYSSDRQTEIFKLLDQELDNLF